MTRQEEKQFLRSRMRELEAQLSAKYKAASSQAICTHLTAMPEYQAADTVFCFVGTAREIDTRPILEDALAAGKRLCVPLCVAKGIMELREITLERTGDLDAALHSDRLWLTQALLNIVKNCMEKTPPGGKISIDVADNAVATQFVIRDTGPGISPEDLPHIFERFYRGKNADENSVGIGLAFTNMVIHNLGGTVKAANHPDGGAMFTVRLIKMNV